MRRLGRPLIAILAAYALLLAPFLGTLAARHSTAAGLALCMPASDRGAPAEPVEHQLCCVLGACAGNGLALAPKAAVVPILSVSSAVPDRLQGRAPSAIEQFSVARPRGPPLQA